MLDASIVDERVAGSRVAVERKADAAAVRDLQAAELAHIRVVDVPVNRIWRTGGAENLAQLFVGCVVRDDRPAVTRRRMHERHAITAPFEGKAGQPRDSFGTEHLARAGGRLADEARAQLLGQ